MSIDMSTVMNGIGAAETQVNDTAKLDMSDPKNLLQFQKEMMEYQQLFGVASAIYSNIKQTAQGIIQKI